MEQVATKRRFAEEARVEHRDTGKKGIPRKGAGGEVQKWGEQGMGGQHISLMGEQGKSRKAVGGKMCRTGSPGPDREGFKCLIKDCSRQREPMIPEQRARCIAFVSLIELHCIE